MNTDVIRLCSYCLVVAAVVFLALLDVYLIAADFLQFLNFYQLALAAMRKAKPKERLRAACSAITFEIMTQQPRNTSLKVKTKLRV